MVWFSHLLKNYPQFIVIHTVKDFGVENTAEVDVFLWMEVSDIAQETGQVVCYSHFFQNFQWFVVIHTVKGFGIVNKAEVDVFLELSWFFYDPMDVGNLTFGSSAFSKSSLNIWKFSVHILLKPGLDNFEHYFTSV